MYPFPDYSFARFHRKKNTDSESTESSRRLQAQKPIMYTLGASIVRTFSMTEASMTKSAKDTKSAKSQKKYFSSMGKMT